MKDLGIYATSRGLNLSSILKAIFFLTLSISPTSLNMRPSDTREVNGPLELNVKYAPSNGVTLPDPTLFQTLVGDMVYLMITRLDIAYVIHNTSQFLVSPIIVH